MNHLFAYLAGCGCALSYGAATVLEQIGARREVAVKKFNPKFLLRLLHQLPFMLGAFLDLIGWLLSLAAVRELPLFLAQSFIASSLVISTLIDRFYLHTTILKNEKIAMTAAMLGLLLLAATAMPAVSSVSNQTFRDFLIVSPAILAATGIMLVNFGSSSHNAVLITVVAGLAFGGTSMAGRAANFSHLSWQTLLSPMVLALIAYGIVGMLLFSIALQRESISRLNSALFATEVAVPSSLGIFFLGDSIRSGLWFLAGIGLALVFAATVIIAVGNKDIAAVSHE